MALTKLIYQDDNEALLRSVERNGEAMVTLIDTDKGIKSAASNLISKDLLEKYRPTDDNTACIHLIAMGNSDQYGFNKNGDWFAGDVLEKTAHTFVTNGHMFREHRNKDPKKAIGTIKHASYDPHGMQRVELIVHMDKDKAPEEYEMAKQGKALNFSMSCRVPNDRCSICGNKAKTIPQYCDHLKYNMGRWIEKEANYAYAFNDEPVFFDISRVANPADRIARHLEYLFKDNQDMKKAAAENDIVIPSAIAAQIEGVNLDVLSLHEQSLMHKLASAEEYIANIKQASDARSYACQSSYPFAMMEKLTNEELTAFREANPGTLFNNLAKRACVLSFPAWCQYITGNEEITNTPMFKKASLFLPSIFGDMFSNIGSIIPCADCFSASSDYKANIDPKNDEIQNLMDIAEEKFSIQQEPVRKRIIRITISIGGNPSVDKLENQVKEAASANASYNDCVELAQAYGQYQIKALSDISNYHEITPNMIDTVAGSNTILLFDR